jgi:hypothetical protein
MRSRILGGTAGLTAGLVGLAVALSGCGGGHATGSQARAQSGPGASSAPTSAPGPSSTAAGTTQVALTVETGRMDGRPGWPRFVPADLTVPAGAEVVLTITSYDDGTAPLPAGMLAYDRVEGGTETVNGSPVTSVPNADVAHTFSVPALGINAVIPAVGSGQRTVTVVFRFTAGKRGVFVWQCFAPCGSGPDGMGGAMAMPGWMRGTITVD